MSKFTFYRMTIDTSEDSLDKKQLISDGLITEAKIGKNEKAFKFVNFAIDSSFIYCELVKYDPRNEDDIFDEKAGKIKSISNPNKVEAKSAIIIDYENSVIAIQSSKIPEYQRENVIKELFENNQKHKERRVVFNIQKISQHYEFYLEVEKFNKIKKVSISLHPSNPRFNDRWKPVDEDLRNRNITNYKESFENKNDQSIIIDEETKSKFFMSEDGYGESTVVGIDTDGEERLITTRDTQKVIQKDLSKKDIDEGFNSIKSNLIDTFKLIKNRILNNE